MTALLLFELEFEDKVTSFSNGAKEAFAEVGVIFVKVDVACCASLLTVTLGRKRISTSPFMEVDGVFLIKRTKIGIINEIYYILLNRTCYCLHYRPR